ncbi:helix-turn-helix domain-containing protein [Belliella sp. DSM 111904]|uniref:Helix-turn-helix domain-containing protein n=2 Tax=Belliella TaxID=232244 RepID=A0ABS9V529_9BACT|nr:helix-turn-helix domain-containing protein [Belliella filtrata]MCH7411478.1 helix-turn-helix domain-containing protein [Belliella filtrata]
MKKGKYRTRLGIYLDQRAINQAEVSRKTGIDTNKISGFCTKDLQLLRISACELYLISLAIKVNPCDLLNHICGDLKIKN